jgi:hypothetical protein
MNNVQQAIRDAAEKGGYRYRWWKVNDLKRNEGYNGLQLRALKRRLQAVVCSLSPVRPAGLFRSAYRADRQGHRSPSLCPSLAPASLVELPSVRMRRVHGGLAWVTEHPTGKARHQEENHERDRRDSEIAVGAARSFPPFC